MCDREPLTCPVEEPSPHRTEYVPSIGRVMPLSELVAAQVVIKAVPVSLTVTFNASAAGCVPSSAVSVRVKVVSPVTEGATKVVEDSDALTNMMRGETGTVCDHVYVISSPSVSVADPESVTVLPSPTTWSSPACTTGGLLALPLTVISSTLQLLPSSNTSSPDAVTLTV